MVHRIANRLRVDHRVHRRTFEVGRNPAGLATCGPGRIRGARIDAGRGEVMMQRPGLELPIADCRLPICFRPTQICVLKIGNWQLAIGNPGLWLGILSLFLLMGCNAQLPGKPTEAERWRAPADVSDFTELYTQNCAGCHGSDGKLGAARSLNDSLYLSFIQDDALKQVISQGRNGTNMPAFSQQAGGALTDRQIALLISGMRASWSKPEAFKGVEIPAYSSIVNASTSGDAPSGARAYQTY